MFEFWNKRSKRKIYPESDFLFFFQQENQIGFRINFLSRKKERARKKILRNDALEHEFFASAFSIGHL